MEAGKILLSALASRNPSGKNPNDRYPELSILLTDDSEIRELNSKFRNKDKATDVLSFSMTEGESGGVEIASLGDVVISVETARDQASELGVSLADELLRLLVHGVLHLVGYEHEDVTKEKALEMERREQELFEFLVQKLKLI